MNKPLMQFAFALLLAFMAGTASAQVQTRAYAPENLRSLSVADQTRVISLEYSEQSRGRRIPDDQLRFYLDQVSRSNWTFSRIKQDIATSLGGGSGGWNPGTGRVVRCESTDMRERSCQTGFRNRARLVRKLSKGECIEGNSWRQQPGIIWVRNGCRGEFEETGDGGWSPGGGSGYSVTCSSEDNRRRTCAWDSRQGRPVVIQNLSKTPCRENLNWGYQGQQIWVDRGCRARFGAGNGIGPQPPAGYSIQCASGAGATNHCAWDIRRGQPYLMQEFSSRRCFQNSSWGYDARRQSVWTRNGCSARFGAR